MGSLPSHTTDQSSFVAGELRRLFLTWRHHLMHLIATLDLSAASADTLLLAPGTVFTIDVGQSGFVAQQLSQTLASLGFLRSAFLPPVDALHGDIGALFPGDILVLISKFGSSDELLSLLPCAHARGAYLLSLTSVEGNPLAAACDLGVHLPLERALCPSDLVPVTSAAIQTLFVDTIAAALLGAHLLTRDRSAAFHPARSIGEGLIHKVSDVISSPADLSFCREGDTILDQLSTIFGKGCGCMLVVDDKYHLIGTFIDGDLCHSLWAYGVGTFKLTVGEMFNRNPRSICPGALVVEALEHMGSPPSALPFLPVVENQNVVIGIITLHGLILPHLGSPSSRSSSNAAHATSSHTVAHHTLLRSISSDILIG